MSTSLRSATTCRCGPCSLPARKFKLAAEKGLPTEKAMPYFNIEWGGKGMIVVLGWPGQWSARFTRDDSGGLRLRAGQQVTHFRLHPGEEVRSPRAVLLWWEGDAVRGQNLWRRWMIAHNMPRPNGVPLKPVLSATQFRRSRLHRNDRGKPTSVDRQVSRRETSHRPLVGRRRMVSGAQGRALVDLRHMGGRQDAVPQRAQAGHGLRTLQGTGHRALVLPGTGSTGDRTSQRTTRTGCLAGAC